MLVGLLVQAQLPLLMWAVPSQLCDSHSTERGSACTAASPACLHFCTESCCMQQCSTTSGVSPCCVPPLQTGISLVGVSRVLAGNDSSGADSLQDLLSTPSSSSSTEPSQASISSLLPMLGIGGGVGGSGVGEGGAAAADPKKALLGMCLIILSQVSGSTVNALAS